MKSRIRYPEELPLEGESGFSRSIFIDSCKIDEEHIQVRGELVDNRADYQEHEKEIPVHGIIIRITFNVNSRTIVRSELSMPQMAFKGICAEELPARAEDLEGVLIGKPLNQKISEIFGATRGCMHLMTLYKAVSLAMNQISSWNHTFRLLDDNCPPESVGTAMSAIHAGIVDTCHAWKADTGGVSRDFAANNYGPMLDRCAPRLLGRWRQYEQDNE